MSGTRRIAALNELLERVRRNARKPRLRGAPSVEDVALPAQARAPDLDDDEVDLDTEPPPAATAAASVARAEREEPDAAVRSGVIPLEDGLELDGDVELESGELIDVTDLSPEEVATIEAEVAEEAESALTDLPDDEALVPSSSRRPKLPEQTKLTASTADLQQDREVPLHTPPPESGRQITAPVQIPAQGAPPRDLLQVGEEISPRPLGPGPTPEQLGETIDLDEPLGGDLELQASEAPTPPPPRRDELEHEPPTGSPGAYDSSLEAPSTAAEDLVRHRAREADVREVPAALPPVAAGPSAVVERPVLDARPMEITGVASPATPRSFRELLDGSLAL